MFACGGLEIAFHLGGGNDAVCGIVDVDAHHVVLPHLHAPLLFAEGHEEVLHEAPVEECAVFVDPTATQAGELAHAAEGSFGGAHEALLLVKVDKDAHDVARPHFVLDIGFGHKDFAHFAAIEVGTVVCEANDSEGVVLSEKHYSIRN